MKAVLMSKRIIYLVLIGLSLSGVAYAQTADFTASNVQVNSSYAYLLRIDDADGIGFRLENESSGNCQLNHILVEEAVTDQITKSGRNVIQHDAITFLRFSYHCQLDEAGHYLLGYRISLEQTPSLRSAIDRKLVHQMGRALHFPLIDLMGVLHIDQALLNESSIAAFGIGTDRILEKLKEYRKEVDEFRSSR